MHACLVATRFHLVGEVQVENSHPHGKTRTHNSKNPGSEPAEDQMPACLVATRFPSCHLVGEVQVKNSHPHGKTCTHNSKTLSRNQLRIRCRYLLWRQDFHLVGEVQVENSHPHGKTCSHVGKLSARLSDGTQRTRFQKADQTDGKRSRNGCVNCKIRG